ncbi:bifunctional DNA-formamidopyrimidine glycosylase/DNA-(apurinic or apyrimidinic site) lyase [soil metagenome]
MPELPEVETIVRDLDHLVRGRTIASVQVLRPDLIKGEAPEGFTAALRGARIRQVTRRAKNIVIELGDQRLVVNLGMTGRLLIPSPGDPRPTHPGVRFMLNDAREMVYHDVRRFGRMQRFPGGSWEERARRMGVEPLSGEFTAGTLHGLLVRSRVAVKTWLMDQRHVVGVGNIYASEALSRAAIDPRRPASSLTAAEAERLRAAVRDVLQEAIEFRGTTLLDYRDARGESGAFAERLRVYDRAGEPCRSCAGRIIRIVQGGRSTFFCERCQH